MAETETVNQPTNAEIMQAIADLGSRVAKLESAAQPPAPPPPDLFPRFHRPSDPLTHYPHLPLAETRDIAEAVTRAQFGVTYRGNGAVSGPALIEVWDYIDDLRTNDAARSAELSGVDAEMGALAYLTGLAMIPAHRKRFGLLQPEGDFTPQAKCKGFTIETWFANEWGRTKDVRPSGQPGA